MKMNKDKDCNDCPDWADDWDIERHDDEVEMAFGTEFVFRTNEEHSRFIELLLKCPNVMEYLSEHEINIMRENSKEAENEEE